jgi:hypothetical protein
MRLATSLALSMTTMTLSCTTVVHNPLPPPPCSPALNCAILQVRQAPLCHPGPDDSKLQWQVSNRHPSSAIYVAYTRFIHHLNQGTLPDESQDFMVKIRPLGVVDLDCRYLDVGPGQFDQYFFAFRSACFEGDTTCLPPNPIVQRPPRVDCSVDCEEPWCIRHAFDASHDPLEAATGKALGEAVQHILSSSPPFRADLTALLGVGSVCPEREDLQFQSDGTFRNLGSTCKFIVPVPSGITTQAVEVGIPAVVEGQLRTDSSGKKTLHFPDPASQIDLQWFDKRGQPLGFDKVDRVILRRDEVRIIGRRHFCIWLNPPPGR